jgi:HD-like signal output (HDOD) protein/DNA-binding NarL/FixJ family response regulator
VITVLLIIKNTREIAALKQLFGKINAKVVTCNAVYSSYLKALQYDPDLVLVELPDSNQKEYCGFIRIIRSNKALDQKTFLLYGNYCEVDTLAAMKEIGVDVFLKRPLDGKLLIDEVRKVIENKAKMSAFVDKNQTSDVILQKLLDPKVMGSEKIALMKQHIKKLFAFPTTVANILRISQSEKGSASDLANIIKTDPSVSTEILKVANSVHFSRSGKRILDIKEAIVRLGFQETKSIAMSLSVFNVMGDKNYETGFSHIEYWFHCLGVALIAERIAQNSKVVLPEEAFIGGLLHDIGLLFYNEFFNPIFLLILDKTTSEGQPFIDCEESIIGFNHKELIKELFINWNFPDILVQSIMGFCKKESLSTDALNVSPLATVVTVADIFAKCLQIGRSGDCCVWPINTELMTALRFPYGLQRNFVDSMYNSLNIFNQILHIDKRTFPAANNLIKNADKVNILAYSFSNEQFNPVVESLKTQRYNLVTVSSTEEVKSRAREFNILLFTDINKDGLEQISSFPDLKVLAFSHQLVDKYLTPTTDTTYIPAKMVLFDAGQEIGNENLLENSVLSRYPVDLRNVDMVMICLLMSRIQKIPLNEIGAFKPNRQMSVIKDKSTIRKVIVAHSRNDIRRKIRESLKDIQTISIEETDSGDKALNLVKTMNEELICAIIDLRISVLACFEIIKQIMILPNHKRAKFVIIFNKASKEELVPYVKIGVRTFLSEDYSAEIIRTKLDEMKIEW